MKLLKKYPFLIWGTIGDVLPIIFIIYTVVCWINRPLNSNHLPYIFWVGVLLTFLVIMYWKRWKKEQKYEKYLRLKQQNPIFTVVPSEPKFSDIISVIYNPKFDYLRIPRPLRHIDPTSWNTGNKDPMGIGIEWMLGEEGVTFPKNEEVYAYVWILDFNDNIIEKEPWQKVHTNHLLEVKRLNDGKIQWDMATTPSEFFGIPDDRIKKIGIVLKNRVGDMKTRDFYIRLYKRD